jgi:hypothetical protein
LSTPFVKVTKRSPAVVRLPDVMKLVTAIDLALPRWFSASSAHAVSWRSMAFFSAALIIGSVTRLLAEWQRRKTLIEVIRHARGKIVVTQGRGRNGPAMRIEVGADREEKDMSLESYDEAN